MESFFTQCGDVQLFTRRIGHGTPVLLIHGACVDSDFFQDTANVLAQNFQPIFYDRRGYGRSKCAPDVSHSIEIQAEDAAALLRACGQPCHIIAHSAGTAIAMELAAHHPELIRRVLLYEPVDADCVEENSSDAASLLEIEHLIQRKKYNSAITQFLPRIGEHDERARPATPDELNHVAANFRCFIRNEFEPVFHYASNANALKQVSIAIGLGERSRNTPRWETACRLAQKLDKPLLYFPGGHNCPFDLPREFAYLSSGFLAEDNKNNFSNKPA